MLEKQFLLDELAPEAEIDGVDGGRWRGLELADSGIFAGRREGRCVGGSKGMPRYTKERNRGASGL